MVLVPEMPVKSDDRQVALSTTHFYRAMIMTRPTTDPSALRSGFGSVDIDYPVIVPFHA